MHQENGIQCIDGWMVFHMYLGLEKGAIAYSVFLRQMNKSLLLLPKGPNKIYLVACLLISTIFFQVLMDFSQSFVSIFQDKAIGLYMMNDQCHKNTHLLAISISKKSSPPSYSYDYRAQSN